MKHKPTSLLPIALFVAASFVAGCGDKSGYPGTEEGAKQLLAEFVKPGADYSALSKPLQPTKDDFKEIFSDGAFADKAHATYTPAWESGALVIKPNEGQTNVRVTPVTVEDLKNGTGNADKFPGGYKDVIDKYKDGRTIYRFEFLAPGEEDGMAYDGLTYVNGNWRIVPKPWRIGE
jgi:hypothetical protein